jgi:hypothetical protein
MHKQASHAGKQSRKAVCQKAGCELYTFMHANICITHTRHTQTHTHAKTNSPPRLSVTWRVSHEETRTFLLDIHVGVGAAAVGPIGSAVVSRVCVGHVRGLQGKDLDFFIVARAPLERHAVRRCA